MLRYLRPATGVDDTWMRQLAGGEVEHVASQMDKLGRHALCFDRFDRGVCVKGADEVDGSLQPRSVHGQHRAALNGAQDTQDRRVKEQDALSWV